MTPQGVRDGDPGALSALTERRGYAVLAYARAVAAPGRDVEAAADAFARFRQAVVGAEDPTAIHPERTLLTSVRASAAARAPGPRRSALLGRRGTDRVCALIPELLAARAEHTLTAADAVRLDRHLERCAACREAETRFHAAERAYRGAPDDLVAQPVAREIMRALLAAAPLATAALDPVADAEPAPVPFVALDPAEEIHAAALDPVYEDEEEDEDRYDDEDDRQFTLVHDMPRLAARPATYEFDALELDDLEEPTSTPREAPGEIPSLFAARTRPPQPGHPGLRFGAPAGVALLGLVVALAIAGVFGSSDSSGSGVSPAAAAVSTPLPAAPAISAAPSAKATKRHATKAKARTRTTTAPSATTATTTPATTTTTTPAPVVRTRPNAPAPTRTPAPAPAASTKARPKPTTTSPVRETVTPKTPTEKAPPASSAPASSGNAFTPTAQPAG